MKNELQTLRLFSPLFPHIYRNNEWGDMDDYREDLTANEVLEYEDEILALIQKEKLPSEGKCGLAVYLDDNLSRKVYSINPSVEEWNRPRHKCLSPEANECPFRSFRNLSLPHTPW